MEATDTKDGFTESCPACGSPYDSRAHTLVECPECGELGSTACCMASRVNGGMASEECAICSGDVESGCEPREWRP